MPRRKKSDSNGIGEVNEKVIELRKQFKPKTERQAEYVRAIAENDITICYGPAGSGKSHIATAIACEYLAAQKVHKIVITRPILEAGMSMGALPGTAAEKIHPYLIPILEEMNYYISDFLIEELIKTGYIEVVPINFMRGRNFHNSFVIIDEAQNCTLKQLKLCLTRFGRNSKMIIEGDLQQSDLREENGLTVCIDKLQDIKGLAIVELTKVDIIRNPIIAHILEKLK